MWGGYQDPKHKGQSLTWLTDLAPAICEWVILALTFLLEGTFREEKKNGIHGAIQMKTTKKNQAPKTKMIKVSFPDWTSVFLGRKNSVKVCGVATSFSIFNFVKHSVRCMSAPHLTHDRTESENQWWMLYNQYYQSQDVKHNLSISSTYSFPKLLLILIPISIHCLPSVPIYVLS